MTLVPPGEGAINNNTCQVNITPLNVIVFRRQVLTREQMKKKSDKLYKSKQRIPVA